MHKTIACLFVVLVASVSSAVAQQRAEIELTRAEIQAKRTEIVGQNINLTEDEEPAFWVLYKEYRAEVAKTDDFETAMLLALDDANYNLTDQEASRLLDNSVKLNRTRLAIVRKYIRKFRSILPAAKVAKFFHLEAKLDAIVDYDIAFQVPLVQ